MDREAEATMAERDATPDRPGGRRARPPVATRAGKDSLRWWLPVGVGVSAIAAGVTLQLVPDVPPRVMAAVVGAVLALGGIACLRRQVTGWVVFAPVAATIWLLSGLSQLVVAATVSDRSGDRVLALGGVSTVIGTAFALWPRSTPIGSVPIVRPPVVLPRVVPPPVALAYAADPSVPLPPEVERWTTCSRCTTGTFHRLRSSSSGSSVQGPWTLRPVPWSDHSWRASTCPRL
jgi:hypothetical protein